MDDNNQPEVIMAKPRFPLPPKIPLILGGTLLVFIAGFVLFEKFYPQTVPTLPSQSRSPAKLTLSCPVPKEFCATGKKIVDKKGLNAIGFSLPVGTPIYATFTGEAEILEAGSDSRTIKKHPVIRLNGTGNQQGYIAHYVYFGPTSSNLSTSFSKGGKVGSIDTGSFPNDNTFFGVNLLFYVTRGKTDITPITLENFTP